MVTDGQTDGDGRTDGSLAVHARRGLIICVPLPFPPPPSNQGLNGFAFFCWHVQERAFCSIILYIRSSIIKQ